LTGEQLLVLVARAVGGVGVRKNDGSVDVPDDLRSIFITGYDAWSNRGAEIDDVWPPPRQNGAGDNFAAPSRGREGFDESIAPKVAERGRRTLQEALEIAKKQEPFALPPNRPAQSGVNVEGLTLGELKQVLEDIERRMRRIDPLHGSGIGNRPVTSGSWGHLGARDGPDTVRPEIELDAATSGDEPGDDPFLKRHVYLKPARRPVPDTPAPLISIGPEIVPASGLPPAVVVPEPVAIPVPAVIDVPPPVSTLSTPLVPSLTVVLPVPHTIAEGGSTPTVLGRSVVVHPEGLATATPLESDYARVFNLRVGSLRISCPSVDIRMVVGFTAALILIAGGYTGVSLYHYLHPRYVYAGLVQPAPSPVAELVAPPSIVAPAEPVAIPVAAAEPAVIPAAPAATKPARKQAAIPSHPISHTSPSIHFFSQRTPPVSVWPPSNQEALRDAQGSGSALSASAAMTARASATSAAASPRRTQAISDAIYVPSSRIMEYALAAPPPIYPQNLTGGAEATVVLQVTISRLGNVTDTKTVSGPLEMRPAAIAAVRMWRFKPYLLDGNPTDVVTTLELPAKAQ
jgi:periplasmic protein TonB